MIIVINISKINNNNNSNNSNNNNNNNNNSNNNSNNNNVIVLKNFLCSLLYRKLKRMRSSSQLTRSVGNTMVNKSYIFSGHKYLFSLAKLYGKV